MYCTAYFVGDIPPHLLLIHFSPLLSNITVTVTVTAGINYYRCNVLYSTVLYCTILYRPIHRYAFSWRIYVNHNIDPSWECIAVYCTVLHSSVLYCIKREGWKREKLENLLTRKEQTDNQTVQRLRPLYPLWILEGVGQLENLLTRKEQTNRQTDKHGIRTLRPLYPHPNLPTNTYQAENSSKTEATLSPVVCGSSGNVGQHWNTQFY